MYPSTSQQQNEFVYHSTTSQQENEFVNHCASQQENRFVHHILQNSTSPWMILQDTKRTGTSSRMTLLDKQGRSSC